MKEDTDTNFGWWTDKPDRQGRPETSRPRRSLHRRRSAAWVYSALVVALMVAFAWSLKSLAGW
jgi:4-hydroxybenzoate polyprenyltransferase